MLKLVTMIRRKADVSVEEFKQHEELNHVPLVKRIVGDDLAAYVRNYPVLGPATGFDTGLDCDALIEAHFKDHAAFERAMATLNARENRALLKSDYTHYLDVSSVRQSLMAVIE